MTHSTFLIGQNSKICLLIGSIEEYPRKSSVDGIARIFFLLYITKIIKNMSWGSTHILY